MPEKTIIGIADDMQTTHDSMQALIKHYDANIEIKHFFSAEETEDFVSQNKGCLSLLFLDVDFGVGMSGDEVLPYLRDDDPDLPIVFLTGIKNDEDKFSELMDAYHVEYLRKPIDSLEFRSKIKNVRRIQNIIQEYKDVLAISSRELEDLKIQAREAQATIEEILANERLLSQNEPKIDAISMIKKVFNNLEFTKYALQAILDTRFDAHLVKILKPLNDNTPLPAGALKTKWHEKGGKKELAFVPDNCFEYRYSGVGRIYTIEESGKKIIVYTIDYDHSKHAG